MPHPFLLHKNFQFRYVYRHGKTLGNEYVVLTYCTAKSRDSKIGLTVSKKNGKATVRNRIKRVMRECARALQPTLNPGYNLVFSASTHYDFTAGINVHVMKDAMRDLLIKAGLLRL